MMLLFQRTGAALSVSAAATVTRIHYNLDQNIEPKYNTNMLTLEIPVVNGMGVRVQFVTVLLLVTTLAFNVGCP